MYGVRYSEDFDNAIYTCITSCEDLYLIKGSKYIQSRKVIIETTEEGKRTIPVWKHVEEQLLKKKIVLFIGLGCDVGALKYYLQRRQVEYDKLLYTIDLICHGATYTKVHTQYVSDLCKRFGSPIKCFSVRYKKKGWTPHYVRAEFENGKFLKRSLQGQIMEELFIL